MRNILVSIFCIAGCAKTTPPPRRVADHTPFPIKCRPGIPGQEGRPQLFACGQGKCRTSRTLPLESPLLFAVQGNWKVGFAAVEGAGGVATLDPVFGMQTTADMPVTLFRLRHEAKPLKPGETLGLFILLVNPKKQARTRADLIEESGCIFTLLVPQPAAPVEPVRRRRPSEL